MRRPAVLTATLVTALLAILALLICLFTPAGTPMVMAQLPAPKFPTAQNPTSGPRIVFGTANDTVYVGQITTLAGAEIPNDGRHLAYLVRDTVTYISVGKMLGLSKQHVLAHPVAELVTTTSGVWQIHAKRQGVQDFSVVYSDGQGHPTATYTRRLIVLSKPPKAKTRP